MSHSEEGMELNFLWSALPGAASGLGPGKPNPVQFLKSKRGNLFRQTF